MAIHFPNSAYQGETYLAENGVEYIYDGVKWVGYGSAANAIPDRLHAGNVDLHLFSNSIVQIPTAGTINVPSRTSDVFPLAMTASNYVATDAKPVLTLTDNAWVLHGSYQYNAIGETEILLDNIWPILVNPGYESGDAFTFGEAVHGIPGHVLTIQLNDVVLPGGAGWTANPTASQPPVYPSTIDSLAAIKLTANDNDLILGTDGNLVLPAGGYVLNSDMTVYGAGSGGTSSVDLGNFVFDGNTLATRDPTNPEAPYGYGPIQIVPNDEGTAGVFIPNNDTADISALTLMNGGNAGVLIQGQTGNWTFTADSNLVLPPGGTILYSDMSNALAGGSSLPHNNTGWPTILKSSSDGQTVSWGQNSSLEFNGYSIYMSGNQCTLYFQQGGSLFAELAVNANVYNPQSVGNVKITSNKFQGAHDWLFGTNGNLTLPAGGTINWSDGSNALTGGSSIGHVVNLGSTGIHAPDLQDYDGEKVVLWDLANQGNLYNYSVGIETDNMWFGVDDSEALDQGFKWYAGNTEVMKVTRDGNVRVSSILTVGNIDTPSASITNTNNYLAIYSNKSIELDYNDETDVAGNHWGSFVIDGTGAYIINRANIAGVVTTSQWYFANGNISLPDGGTITNIYGETCVLNPAGVAIAASIGNAIAVSEQYGAAVYVNNNAWQFQANANVILPTGGYILNSDNSVYGASSAVAGIGTQNIELSTDLTFTVEELTGNILYIYKNQYYSATDEHAILLNVTPPDGTRIILYNETDLTANVHYGDYWYPMDPTARMEMAYTYYQGNASWLPISYTLFTP